MQPLDDIALLREYAANGSEEAFAALVMRHVNKVYSAALRHTRNPHAAEEITQAVFILLAKKSRDLPKSVILSGWLCRTAQLTAMTFTRNEIRRARREQEAHMESIVNENESDAWFHIAPLLDAAMAGLNASDHHAVVLRFFDGRSMREIGAALGASEDTAKKRVNRAVEKLRQFFTKRGVVVSSAVLTAAISVNSVQAAPATLAKSVTVIALTHGSVATSSTLTLIKGALKIMAWTKVKTGIVTGAVLVLIAGATPTIVRMSQRHAEATIRSKPRNTVATETVRGQFFELGQLVDAGNTTPEAAWETRYWARARGDYDAVIAATDPQALDNAKGWMGDKASFRRRSQEEFAGLLGFQIVARKDLANDRVELKYQFGFGDASPQMKVVAMVKINGVWKCAQTRAYEASWDVDSQPEPQS